MEPNCTSRRAPSIRNKDQTLPHGTPLEYSTRDPATIPPPRVDQGHRELSREIKTTTTSTTSTATGRTEETGETWSLTIMWAERRRRGRRRRRAMRQGRSPSGGMCTGREPPSRQTGQSMPSSGRNRETVSPDDLINWFLILTALLLSLLISRAYQ